MGRIGVIANKEPEREIARYDRYAVISLVLGILGLLLPFVGIILSIPGIVFGRRGLKSRKVGMAKVAMAVSILGTSIWIGLGLWFAIYLINGGEIL